MQLRLGFCGMAGHLHVGKKGGRGGPGEVVEGRATDADFATEHAVMTSDGVCICAKRSSVVPGASSLL